MTPTEVCNIALAEMGNRVAITSLTQVSPAAQAANLFYTPKTQMLLRSANWAFARAQQPLTLWKALIVNGQISSNPPPQPWQFSYLYPNDCVKMRFVQPTVTSATSSVPLTTAPTSTYPYPPIPTSVPFVEATDRDDSGNPIRVLLTNVQDAQGIYTRDLSQYPDLWDPMFLSGETALLASYFINSLAPDKGRMAQQIGLAKSAIDAARAASANESISNADHIPDWIMSRMTVGNPWGRGLPGANGQVALAAWEQCQFPDGQWY